MVLALGSTPDGDKVLPGFVQTDTENARAIPIFLRGLVDRGLDLSAGALVVTDEGMLLQAEIGVEVDLGRLDTLVAEPQSDNRGVDTGM